MNWVVVGLRFVMGLVPAGKTGNQPDLDRRNFFLPKNDLIWVQNFQCLSHVRSYLGLQTPAPLLPPLPNEKTPLELSTDLRPTTNPKASSLLNLSFDSQFAALFTRFSTDLLVSPDAAYVIIIYSSFIKCLSSILFYFLFICLMI